MQHRLFPVIIIIIHVDSFVSLSLFLISYRYSDVDALILKGLEITEEEYFRLNSINNNDNNVSPTTNSTLSRRKLPNGSPTVAEKRKLKRIKRLNHIEYTVKCAVEAGIIFLCKESEDDCPTKTEVCAKWHEPNEFMKHWICRVCFRCGKYKSKAAIERHMRSMAHFEWYSHNLR